MSSKCAPVHFCSVSSLAISSCSCSLSEICAQHTRYRITCTTCSGYTAVLLEEFIKAELSVFCPSWWLVQNSLRYLWRCAGYYTSIRKQMEPSTCIPQSWWLWASLLCESSSCHTSFSDSSYHNSRSLMTARILSLSAYWLTFRSPYTWFSLL